MSIMWSIKTIVTGIINMYGNAIWMLSWQLDQARWSNVLKSGIVISGITIRYNYNDVVKEKLINVI